MTWSYSSALATDKDKVRALIGDTDTNAQLVTDEAIAVWLTQESSVYGAAAMACLVIAASFARQIQTSADGFSSSLQQRHEHYVALAKTSKTEAASVAGGSAGIVSPIADVADGNTLRDPAFTIGMHDNP